MKVVIITPARDEAQYISKTITCMVEQTIYPVQWIIVDDGSKDSTGKIVQDFMKKYSFIDYIYIPDRGYRKPGAGVVTAFYEGYNLIKNHDYDIIAKMDADIRLPKNMIEIICNAFKQNDRLGITGGTQYERINSKSDYNRVLVPKGFVLGPQKFYRRKCFEDIGGLIFRAGWDGVDIIRANMSGWETGEIESLKVYHLRTTGTAIGEGLIRACQKYGDVSYYMGGYLWYFIIRILARSIEARNLKVGFYMAKGYFESWRSKVKRENYDFRSFLKRKQIENIIEWMKYGYRKIV